MKLMIKNTYVTLHPMFPGAVPILNSLLYCPLSINVVTRYYNFLFGNIYVEPVP